MNNFGNQSVEPNKITAHTQQLIFSIRTLKER